MLRTGVVGGSGKRTIVYREEITTAKVTIEDNPLITVQTPLDIHPCIPSFHPRLRVRVLLH